MKIKKLAAAEKGTLHLKGADDELLYDDDAKQKPVTVTVFGPGSAVYQKAEGVRTNRILERQRRKGGKPASAEELRGFQVEMLATCTEGFEHLEYDDAPDATGSDLARAVYSDPEIGFIFDQVQAYIGDWANFTKGSATS